MKKSLVSAAVLTETEDGYPDLELLVRARMAEAPGPWFTTDSGPAVYVVDRMD